MPKTAKPGAKKAPGASIRKTRAVKGPRTSSRRVEVAGTPAAGTYVDPLVIKESEEAQLAEDLDNGPEAYDDPEDVYEGVDDQAMQGPFSNPGGRL